MAEQSELQILHPGEQYERTRFGCGTVNRGAMLLDCEWDGGRFESGVFIGGMFRSGDFAGGTWMGGIFLNGTWHAGVWEGGFDPKGIYRPRGETPACW